MGAGPPRDLAEQLEGESVVRADEAALSRAERARQAGDGTWGGTWGLAAPGAEPPRGHRQQWTDVRSHAPSRDGCVPCVTVEPTPYGTTYPTLPRRHPREVTMHVVLAIARCCFIATLGVGVPLAVRAQANPSPAQQNPAAMGAMDSTDRIRSEEHTSELQSQSNLVCRLLLEKKKNTY